MMSYLLLFIILIPLISSCLVLSARDDKIYAANNVYNVSIWGMLTNIGVILYIFSLLDIENNGIQMKESYQWLTFPPISFELGVDIFSLLVIMSVNMSFLIACICLDRQNSQTKEIIASELLFISLLNGYFISADIISFYIFFAALSAPLIMLMSTSSSLKKKNALLRFSLYNFIGEIWLFVCILLIYNYKQSNIPLTTMSESSFPKMAEYFIWSGLFFSFISRLPIWPFHYWISAVNSGLKNPLAFVAGNLIPLVGLYGFIRFWSNSIPENISVYAPWLEGICIITMLFIALVSLSHKDFRYKLFAYTTIYYLIYLLAIFLPTDVVTLNIGYSLFSYIIIITVLSFLISYIENQKKKLNLYGLNGILCYMPRASKCLSLFVLAGIGLPVTPLFWNNFIIISEIFNSSLIIGILVMLSLFIVALSLLEELYKLKDKSYATTACVLGTDLPNVHFATYMISLIILFFSFFKPLWFVF